MGNGPSFKRILLGILFDTWDEKNNDRQNLSQNLMWALAPMINLMFLWQPYPGDFCGVPGTRRFTSSVQVNDCTFWSVQVLN